MKQTVFACLLLVVAATLPAAQRFKDVRPQNDFRGIREGHAGSLVVDGGVIAFESKDGRVEMPVDAVKELLYSNVASRRVTAAVLISPWAALAKSQKHFLALTVNDGAENVGSVEFRLDKSNYRPLIRALEEATGLRVNSSAQARVGGPVGMAARSEEATREPTLLVIESDPPGAEVYIDGAFNGLTPRRKVVKPGEYEVRVQAAGVTPHSRTVTVAAGETRTVVIGGQHR